MGKEMKYKYLFGPVASRRLGASLGVDMMPHKTCSMDCVYCECGRTTALTLKRREYVPADAVIKELAGFLKSKPKLDYITFSGSGEPTLHSGLAKIIKYLKTGFPEYKIAVITNGSLFFDAAVRKSVRYADLILPSLDAVSAENFEKINRPAPKLDVKKVVKGLADLKKGFRGEIWLEIFIVPGINDTPRELKKLKDALEKIRPDRVQINALDRPGTEKWVLAEKRCILKKIAKIFGKKAEIIASKPRRVKKSGYSGKASARILNTVKRRPCTLQELLNITELPRKFLKEELARLLKSNKIVSAKLPRGSFFKIKKHFGH